MKNKIKFSFISKAATLAQLKSRIKKSKILDLIRFNQKEWIGNKKNILNKIKKNFRSKIIIRSSALDEDNILQSQAGKYLTITDVDPSNTKVLIKSIQKVFKKYKSKNFYNEILIQPILKNVSASGVIFSYDNEQGSPYYCIEYDDLTGQTDTVTAGKNDKSRTLYVLRSKVNSIKSSRFLNLIKAVEEIENITSYPKLDIEFGINKKNKVFIFQVRPLVIKKIINQKVDLNIQKQIKKLENYYISKNKNKAFGKLNIFGVMPDWNPAEMIGILPKPLAKTFYAEIITNKIWALSRKNLGYKDLSKYKLMEDFADHPYINTNLSFYSFLPKKISHKISKKIVNFWIDDLVKNNYKHDKIEFEICETCFNFSTDKKLKKLRSVLSKSEINIYRDELFNLTKKILENNISIIQKSNDNLKTLEFYRDQFKRKKNKNSLDVLNLIKNIKKFGTLNFANMARIAFISESFLRSFVTERIFTVKRLNNFKNSISTILTHFVNDTNKLIDKEISWKEFCKIYGHLRSGTYDIQSERYDKSTYFNVNKLKFNKISKNKKQFRFKKKEIDLIDLHLKKSKINLSALSLIDIVMKNIAFREYCKFIFTKSVSDILEFISMKGKIFHINKDNISFLKLHEIKLFDHLKNKKKIQEKIAMNKKKYVFNKLIQLPYLITKKTDFSIVPLLKGVPNYITSKKITAECMLIRNKQENKLSSLKNKIILIESADPGYDWVFLYGIAGLITKYGGSNSHMSIRCSEMNIPAVIGCGEQLFKNLACANLIEIDCNLSQTKVIN